MNKNQIKIHYAASISLLLFSASASASIVSGSVTGGTSLSGGGIFVHLTVPFTDSTPDNTVGNNNFNTLNLYGLDELQNTTLTSDLNIDILADGLGGGGGAGIISSGTTISSHYIFFDPATNKTQQGDVSFDSNVLGIIRSNGNLSSSVFLGNPGVTYASAVLPSPEGADSTTIASLQSIAVNWGASSPGDHIRVITEASVVPVPAAVWLFGSGLLGLVGISRRKASAVSTYQNIAS